MPASDYYSSYGAGVLARRIEKFWKARGFKGIVVERFRVPGVPNTFGLRSNLVNGMPPFRTNA